MKICSVVLKKNTGTDRYGKGNRCILQLLVENAPIIGSVIAFIGLFDLQALVT
jgi:hypothetical protein